MCRSNLIVSCVFLLVVCATENQVNSIRENEQYNIVQDEFHNTSAFVQNHDSNFTRDNVNAAQQENRRNYSIWLSEYTKSYYEKSNQDTSVELRENSTKTNNGGNFTIPYDIHPEYNPNEANMNNMCNNSVCIPMCRQLYLYMIKSSCAPNTDYYSFLVMNGRDKKMDEVSQLIVSDSCQSGSSLLEPKVCEGDEYTILSNGSVLQTNLDSILDSSTYCFVVVEKKENELTECLMPFNNVEVLERYQAVPTSIAVSLPFLLLTLVVYIILPELWNIHGYALCGYVSSLSVAYAVTILFLKVRWDTISDNVCIAGAFVFYFLYLASYFWLHVMCFNIWWTFRKYRPLQRNVKQRNRTKYIICSIYVCGCCSLLCIVCAIMDFVPSVPENFIKPGFGKINCWFETETAKLLYFYVPVTITIICNICMFISTLLKFIRHKENMAPHVTSSETKINDDRHWFKLFMKLFILMVCHYVIKYLLSSSLTITEWFRKNAPKYITFFADLVDIVRGLMVFIIFVWNNKVKRLLLKRFGCEKITRCLFSKNSQSDCHDMSVHADHSSTEVTSLSEEVSVYRRMYTTFVRQNRPTVSYGLDTTGEKGCYRAYSQSVPEN